jgi:probable F420-dependent oxidoreductase
MKFMVECPVMSEADGGAWISADSIAEFARTAEESGIDAVAFTDHPAPSKKWLDTGGHETFDPFVALGFCAAVTSTLKLMTNLTVVPYRNPLLMARSMTSVDVLSSGRTIFTLGTGYLRSEFAALGVDFEERNALFDEAVEVLRGVWSTGNSTSTPESTPGGFSYEGRHFKAIGQIIKPGPVQRPYPPLWLGGNAKVVLDRVARWGNGWAPLLGGGPTLARTTRTAVIGSDEKLAEMIRDLGARLEANGRSLGEIDVLAASMESSYTPGAPERFLDTLGRFAEMGVTWSSGYVARGSFRAALDSMRQFGEEAIARSR